jgi:hypothetical protein
MQAQCGLVANAAKAAGTNGLKCLPKHGGARGNNFLVSHAMTDQCCLPSAIARRSVQTEHGVIKLLKIVK